MQSLATISAPMKSVNLDGGLETRPDRVLTSGCSAGLPVAVFSFSDCCFDALLRVVFSFTDLVWGIGWSEAAGGVV